MKKRYQHVIPRDLVGLATLFVDYLSRWGEEMEALSILLATLIIGLILDLEGLFENTVLAIFFGVIVALEFIYILLVALKRRVLEYDLWRAVYEMGHDSDAHYGSDEPGSGRQG